MLIDLSNKGVTELAEQALGQAHITVNKNMVPFDTRSPFVTSGMRVGTPQLPPGPCGVRYGAARRVDGRRTPSA